MRNIEVSPGPIGGTTPIGLISPPSAETASAVRRKIGIAIAVAALCATVAGCISDIGAATPEKSDGSQLRYFGGPKSPMWSGQ